MEVCPEGFVEMNSNDMKELGLQEEETVKITSRDGTAIQVRVKKSHRAPKGTVIVPEHFSPIKLNILTQRRQPVVNVRVEKT